MLRYIIVFRNGKYERWEWAENFGIVLVLLVYTWPTYLVDVTSPTPTATAASPCTDKTSGNNACFCTYLLSLIYLTTAPKGATL